MYEHLEHAQTSVCGKAGGKLSRTRVYGDSCCAWNIFRAFIAAHRAGSEYPCMGHKDSGPGHGFILVVLWLRICCWESHMPLSVLPSFLLYPFFILHCWRSLELKQQSTGKYKTEITVVRANSRKCFKAKVFYFCFCVFTLQMLFHNCATTPSRNRT